MEIIQLPNLSSLSYLSFSISPVPVSWLLCLSDQYNIPYYLFNHYGISYEQNWVILGTGKQKRDEI